MRFGLNAVKADTDDTNRCPVLGNGDGEASQAKDHAREPAKLAALLPLLLSPFWVAAGAALTRPQS